MKDKKLIPPGLYCYFPLTCQGAHLLTLRCPYWSINEDQPEQDNGHCAFLGEGDWESDHLGLLWDQVKECGENCDYCEYIYDDVAVSVLEKEWIKYMLEQGKVPAEYIELVKSKIEESQRIIHEDV